MITGVWMDEGDGAMRLAVEIDDGDGDLLIVDFDYDPPLTTRVAELERDGWVGMGPTA